LIKCIVSKYSDSVAVSGNKSVLQEFVSNYPALQIDTEYSYVPVLSNVRHSITKKAPDFEIRGFFKNLTLYYFSRSILIVLDSLAAFNLSKYIPPLSGKPELLTPPHCSSYAPAETIPT